MATHSTPGSVRPEDRSNRLQRFTDILDIDEQGRTEEPGSPPFYYGESVTRRTGEVRGAIEYVRKNWSNYGTLMEGLKVLLKDRLGDPLPGGETGDLNRLLSSSKEWRDRRSESSPSEEEDYSAIRLYASTFGHKEVIKITNIIFRTGGRDSQQQDELNTVMFLVELVNVDLFNYVSRVPRANNFQGVVFRALAASNEQLQHYQELAARPIPDRYWAIPLVLLSASRNQDMAVTFAKGEVQRQPDLHLFLWRIHVVELDVDLLQIYREKFPSSVVSTICAVPIQELSHFPEEDEVVLRGPFFQLVRMQEEVLEGVGNAHVMDSVMVTANRDHPSTMELGEAEGRQARELTACLVEIGRAKACRKLAEEYGMLDDVEIYEQLVEQESERLKSILAA